MIPPAFIQDLLARTDIVEIVGRAVTLKKAGASYKGLCPFHGEKTPSFTVSPSHQTYHCFGCGVHGNAIGFLIEQSGLGFPDAVRDLAQRLGLQVPDDERSPEERERAGQMKERQATLSGVLAKAAAHYRKCLKKAPGAIDYLKRRGLSGDVAARFGLGYAPDGWRNLASAFPSYDDPLLEESGLVVIHPAEDGGRGTAQAKRYDRFRDRIVFPIRSVQGEVIGFGGRVLGSGEPKYLNSPETPIFVKGRELYGLHEARAALRAKGSALVVEGYMDVVALAQHGFENAVATLGTACTAEQVQKLFRFAGDVVFAFDGDAAGRRAAGRALEAALPHVDDSRSARFLFLPAEHDPDSFVREHGAVAFERCIAEALPLSRQLVEVARAGCDLSSAEGRARLTANARPLWSALVDGALKRQLLVELARLAQLPTDDLLDLWRPKPPDGRRAGPSPSPSPSTAPQRPPRATAGRSARSAPAGPADHALRLLLLNAAWWDRLDAGDHDLLHGLPTPHGEVCAWLERHLAEHGAQPWTALAAALAASDVNDAALRLVGTKALEDDASFGELRRVIDGMWVARLAVEQQALISAAAHDPAALERWRAIEIERRRRLDGSGAPPGADGGFALPIPLR